MRTVSKNQVHEFRDKIMTGLDVSFNKLLETKARLGQKFVLIQDDRIVHLSAEEIMADRQNRDLFREV